jgi:hypothetical protein
MGCESSHPFFPFYPTLFSAKDQIPIAQKEDETNEKSRNQRIQHANFVHFVFSSPTAVNRSFAKRTHHAEHTAYTRDQGSDRNRHPRMPKHAAQ